MIAIMHADMAGYLIGLDDLGTLDRLRVLRKDLIDPAIDDHGGRPPGSRVMLISIFPSEPADYTRCA
jgi:hypothetical protein